MLSFLSQWLNARLNAFADSSTSILFVSRPNVGVIPRVPARRRVGAPTNVWTRESVPPCPVVREREGDVADERRFRGSRRQSTTQTHRTVFIAVQTVLVTFDWFI